eukprot:3104033-Rhodomonas_salina.1
MGWAITNLFRQMLLKNDIICRDDVVCIKTVLPKVGRLSRHDRYFTFVVKRTALMYLPHSHTDLETQRVILKEEFTTAESQVSTPKYPGTRCRADPRLRPCVIVGAYSEAD